MLRRFGYALLVVLGVSLAHGVGWSMVGLTFGMVAVAVGGGWLIGYALKRADAGSDQSRPRRLPALAALLGLLAYILGSFVAFAIVQLSEGQGGLLDRLSPANFGAFMQSLFEPPLLQLAVLAAYVIVAWFSARPGSPRASDEAG